MIPSAARANAGLRRVTRLAITSLVCLVGTGAALAQVPPVEPDPTQPDSVYEHRAIAEILLLLTPDTPGTEPTPLADDLRSLALNQIRSHVGQAYQGEVFAADIRRLTRLPEFGPIASTVQLRSDGQVTLTITVSIQPMIRDVQVVGNRLISDQDIADIIGALVDTPIDRFRIDRFARRVEDLYREKGYHLARVEAQVDDIEETGTLIFVVREGERMRVTDIRFVGVEEELDFSPRELKREIKTKTAGLFETGPLDEQALATDRTALRQFYLDRGYLDARVDFRITTSLNGREAIVEFLLSEGQRYTMRSVRVFYPEYVLPGRYPTREDARKAAKPSQGVHVLPDAQGRLEYVIYDYGVFSAEQISGFIDIKAGDVYSDSKIRKVDQEIASRYGQMGYTHPADTTRRAVTHLEMRDEREPFVDLFIVIRERAPGLEHIRFRTGEVIIKGNDHTDHRVIREKIELRPDRPLDTTAIQESLRRIQLSRLFDPRKVKLTIQDPDPLQPNYRDVLVEVEETNTGEINLGGMVTSDSGLNARLAIKQRNFDIADTPDSWGEFFSGRAFRGGGQTVSLELMPGTQVATYSLAFFDPTFLGSRNSFNSSISFRNRQFVEYDERRIGARIGVGRRFGSRWTGGVSVRAQSVELSDLDAGLPADVFAVADDNTLLSVGLNFVRTSVDNQYIATRGNRMAFRVEQVGGDFSFTKIEGEYAVYVPVYEDFTGRATVFSFQTHARFIPQDSASVPTYERYYLGGQSFRGFDFRTISPKGLTLAGLQTDDPVGGTWAFFAGIELRQPIYAGVVSVVGFIDTGTVTEEFGFDEYRVSTGFGIRLTVPFSQIPLAFDFGFPLVSQSLDDDRLFTFSVDFPFR